MLVYTCLGPARHTTVLSFFCVVSILLVLLSFLLVLVWFLLAVGAAVVPFVVWYLCLLSLWWFVSLGCLFVVWFVVWFVVGCLFCVGLLLVGRVSIKLGVVIARFTPPLLGAKKVLQ